MGTMATLSKPALRTSPTLSSATLRSAPTARPPSGPQPKWKPKSKVMTATVAAAAGATWRIATMVFIAADLGRALAQRAAPWRMRWTPLSGYWQQGHQLPNRLQCECETRRMVCRIEVLYAFHHCVLLDRSVPPQYLSSLCGGEGTV